MTTKQTVKHEWDLTSDYCIHCGMDRVHQLDSPKDCYRHKDVTAISHTRAKVIHGIRTPNKSSNPNSK